MTTRFGLSLWTKLPCNSGTMVCPVLELESWTLPDKLGANDQRFTCVIKRDNSAYASLQSGMVLVTEGPDGTTERDWFIATIEDASDNDLVTITALSVDTCLAAAGVITQTTNGITTALIGTEQRSFVSWLDQRFVPNLAADDLGFFVGFGVNDATDDRIADVIEIAVNNLNRGQLLKALTDATGTTAVWVRVGRTGYGIGFYETPGSTAAVIRLGTGAQIRQLKRTRDIVPAFTDIEPTGTAGGGYESNLLDNAWEIVSLTADGSDYWVELVDADPNAPSTAGPVLEAHQFGSGVGGVDCSLRQIDGTAITVTDARITPTNSVKVGALSSLVVGDRVEIVSAGGGAMRRLISPSARTTFGRPRVLNFATGVPYGHRNWAENALFDSWASGSSPTNWTASGTMNVRRVPTQTTFTALLNGAVSASTTLVLDGCPDNSALLDGETITIGGVSRTVSGDAYAVGGAMTVTITASITAADNAPIVLTVLKRPSAWPDDAQSNALELLSASAFTYPPVYGHNHRRSRTVKVRYLAGLATLHAAVGFTITNSSGVALGNRDSGSVITDDVTQIDATNGRYLPSVMIVRTDTSTALATATVPLQVAGTGVPSNQTVHCSTDLTADRSIGLALVGLSTPGATIKGYARWASLWLANADDIPPPWEGSRATKIWRRAHQRLSLAMNDARYSVELQDLSGQTLVLGGSAVVYDRALGVKATVRVLGVTYNDKNPDVPQLEVAGREQDLASFLATQ